MLTNSTSFCAAGGRPWSRTGWRGPDHDPHHAPQTMPPDPSKPGPVAWRNPCPICVKPDRKLPVPMSISASPPVPPALTLLTPNLARPSPPPVVRGSASGLKGWSSTEPMQASPAESALYRHLFSDDAAASLFTDTAEVRALMLGQVPSDARNFATHAAAARGKGCKGFVGAV